MKRTKLLLVGLLAALPILGWAVVVHAQSFQHGNNITVAANQTLDQTLFAAGKTIDIAGTVNGDVFCAGQNVTVTGTVNGDLICAGQDVHVSGHVSGDIRVAGQDVTLSGEIGHNLTAAGQNVTLESSSEVYTDATVGGQDVTLNGTIGRDLASGASNLTINGKIGRNVQSADEQLALGSNANIAGTVTYTSNNKLTQANGAHVGGAITQKTPPQKNNQPLQLGAFIRGGLWFALYLFVAALVAAMVLVLLLPQTFHTATQVAIEKPGKTILVGLISSIVVPIAIGIIFFTIIGIPLAILALLIWLVILMLSGAFAAYYTGRLLLQKTTNALLIMLVGAVVLMVLYFVPFLGALVSIVAAWFGLGIIMSHIIHLPRPNYQVAAVHTGNATAAKKPKK